MSRLRHPRLLLCIVLLYKHLNKTITGCSIINILKYLHNKYILKPFSPEHISQIESISGGYDSCICK